MLKGNYAAGTTYSVGDLVKYTDGAIYRLHFPATSGTPPTNTRYWTRQVSVTELAALLAVDAQANAVGEIPALANNLTTSSTGKALDAKQGKVLKGLIDDLTEALGALDLRVTALEEGDETEQTPGTGGGEGGEGGTGGGEGEPGSGES